MGGVHICTFTAAFALGRPWSGGCRVNVRFGRINVNLVHICIGLGDVAEPFISAALVPGVHFYEAVLRFFHRYIYVHL